MTTVAPKAPRLPLIPRRNFLFGAAAAIAAATVPWPESTAVEVIPHKFLRRMIREIHLYFDNSMPAQAALIKIGQLGRPTILECGMNTQSVFLWHAGYEGDIVMLTDDVLEINVEPAAVAAKMFLIAADKIDEGPPVLVAEIYDSQKGPPTLAFLHADNSLEARLEREKIKPAPIDWDDDDECDES